MCAAFDLGNLFPLRKNFRNLKIKVLNSRKISEHEYRLGKAFEMFYLLLSLIHRSLTEAKRNSYLHAKL